MASSTDSDHDELDILTPMNDAESSCTSNTSALPSRESSHRPAPRRSLRPRQSIERVAPSSIPRKRALSAAAIEGKTRDIALKKIKLDEKKAVRLH